MRRNYLSTISARYNPDILAGGSFIRGNQYYAVLHENDEIKKASENESGEECSEAKMQETEETDEDGAYDNLKKLKG